MTYHPFLASAGSPFERLVRACFWQVADPDFRHAAYWRDQVERATTDFLASLVIPEGCPAFVVASRSAAHRELCARAIVVGFEAATKRRVLAVEMPSEDFTMRDAAAGFGSGSVCNTRTLCHGWQLSPSDTPRTLCNGLQS